MLRPLFFPIGFPKSGWAATQRRQISRKPIISALEAVQSIKSKDTLLCGGFGLCGVPLTLLKALAESNHNGAQQLKVVSNDAGTNQYGLGPVIESGKVERIVLSYIGDDSILERMYIDGKIEVELTPQGTLTERLYAGGAGIPAVYLRAGVGTLVQSGGLVIQTTNDIRSERKETRRFDGKEFIMERNLRGQVAFIKADKCDRLGNVSFRGTARNFNALMAKAADMCIVEADRIVDVLPSHAVHLSGIYTHAIVQSTEPKRVEHLVVNSDRHKNGAIFTARERLAWRVAKEFREGMYINLGIGIPTLSIKFIPKNISVTLQSENGLLGLGPYPESIQQADFDITDAGKETVTVNKGGAFLFSDDTFGMIHRGMLDLTVLGALQVSCDGDLANWIVPGQMVKGMGGAMDLSGCLQSKVIVATRHCTKVMPATLTRQDGRPKIVQQCTLPLTARRTVRRIVTDMCVFDVTDKGLVMVEIWDKVDIGTVRKNTGCDFTVGRDLSVIKIPN